MNKMIQLSWQVTFVHPSTELIGRYSQSWNTSPPWARLLLARNTSETIWNSLMSTSQDPVNRWQGRYLCPDLCHRFAVVEVQSPEQHQQGPPWAKAACESDASSSAKWEGQAVCRHWLWRSAGTPVEIFNRKKDNIWISPHLFLLDLTQIRESWQAAVFSLLWCETVLQSKSRGGIWGLVLAAS